MEKDFLRKIDLSSILLPWAVTALWGLIFDFIFLNLFEVI